MSEDVEPRKELDDMFNRRGKPGDLQREIYDATLPILKKYIAMNASHMTEYRILGLSLISLEEAFYSAHPKNNSKK
jgi:hypothetical protein